MEAEKTNIKLAKEQEKMRLEIQTEVDKIDGPIRARYEAVLATLKAERITARNNLIDAVQ